jgi:probable phosphomutase (TIGR03848 family)
MAPRRPAHPAVTTVYLVRHGRTPSTGKVLPGRAPGLELSPEGRAQAEAAAGRLAELRTAPVAVYASPLERTRQTAAPIARALGLRVRTERGLLECDFGDWTGASLARLAKKPEWRTVQAAPTSFRFPSGESFAEMATRTWEAVIDLGRRHRGSAIVCVSHADPIKAVLAQAAGAPLDMFQRLTVAPCSISTLLLSDHGPMVLNVNTTGTLSGLEAS